MTDLQRQRLQAAFDCLAVGKRGGIAAREIIAEMERFHGATYRDRYDGRKLRCCGLASSCTGSDAGLLANWQRAATLKLMEAA